MFDFIIPYPSIRHPEDNSPLIFFQAMEKACGQIGIWVLENNYFTLITDPTENNVVLCDKCMEYFPPTKDTCDTKPICPECTQLFQSLPPVDIDAVMRDIFGE